MFLVARNKTAASLFSVSTADHRTGRKWQDIAGGCRKLHNEELCLSSSPNIIRTVNCRRIGWAGHVARMEKRNAGEVFMGRPERKRLIGRRRNRWEIFKMVLKKQDGNAWTGLIWLRIGICGELF